jgi:aminopeptidase YwaD
MKHLFSLLILLLSLNSYAQTDAQLAERSVSKAEIQAHISFLASDHLKGRDTPSPEQEIAAQYIRSFLQMNGVKAFDAYPDYLQPVHLQQITPASAGTLKVGEKQFALTNDFLLLNGSNGSLQGEVVFAGYGSVDELKKARVNGKMAVVNAGDGKDQTPQNWFRMAAEKRARAKAAGATGLIELYYSAQMPWSMVSGRLSRGGLSLMDEKDDPAFVHVMLNNGNNEHIGLFQQKGAKASMEISGKSSVQFTAYNVVGYLEGTDEKLKNEFVMYSAHYDHVGIGRKDARGDSIYNGARDNAVGTTTVLAAAKNFGLNPTKRSSLFVLFTAEEKGLLGSRWFADRSPVPLNQIVYCFNSDNGGYNNTGLATVVGLKRTTAEAEFTLACETFGLQVNDDPTGQLFNASDNVNFARKGIPAPTFSMGFTAFDAEIMKYYHQPADHAESLDYDYLEKFFRAYVLAARLIGNRTERPFWVEGDAYFEAGKGLYGR